MDTANLRRFISECVREYLNEAEEDKKESKGAKQVKSFLDSLQKSSISRKLKSIDTNKEKLEILVKFAELIDFPKDKITKLSTSLRSK